MASPLLTPATLEIRRSLLLVVDAVTNDSDGPLRLNAQWSAAPNEGGKVSSGHNKQRWGQ
jgi:hypothetical protein